MRIYSVLALGLVVLACGSSTPAPVTPAAAKTAAPAAVAPSAGLKPMGEAKLGDKTKCPISGEEFVVDASSPKAEHNGKTYYFCCPGCEKKFMADPAKYGVGSST